MIKLWPSTRAAPYMKNSHQPQHACVLSHFSHVQLFVSDPGIEPMSCVSCIADEVFTTESPLKPHTSLCLPLNYFNLF